MYGTLGVHDDPEWLGDHVRQLSAVNEAGFDQPWSVDDAPAPFISGQLRAIVGLCARGHTEAAGAVGGARPAPKLPGPIK